MQTRPISLPGQGFICLARFLILLSLALLVLKDFAAPWVVFAENPGTEGGSGQLSISNAASGSVLIADLVVFDSANSIDWSVSTNIQPGDLLFGDRSYTVSTIGANLAGSDWIRTANDSKAFLGTPLVTFRVTADAEVYIAHRDEISPKPAWLNPAQGWIDTGQDLINSEPVRNSLFKKNYSANTTVTLGNNGHTTYGLYTVIVKPVEDLPTATTAPASTQTPLPTSTFTPTTTRTLTSTPTRTVTATSTSTQTPTRTLTHTPSPAPPLTATASSTVPGYTITPSPASTQTHTPTLSSTNTPTSTPISTSTLTATVTPTPTPAPVQVFRIFELSLNAKSPGSLPYLNGPSVSATFTGVSGAATGQTLTIKGFWDGGALWKIRFAPTASGIWSYVTSSSDPGLADRTGSLLALDPGPAEVAANPLLHGFLQPDGFAWKLSDGTPFLPVGDTQWSFAEETTLAEWQRWMAARQAQGFNTFLGMVWLALYDRPEATGPPFPNQDPRTEALQVAYFQRLDQMVQYSNDHGILMGLSIGGFPENSSWFERFGTRERNDRWFQYVVARYAAYNVRWVLYGEANELDPPWGTTWYVESAHNAQLVRDEDPYDHPIGNHHISVDTMTAANPNITYILLQLDRTETQFQEVLAQRIYGKPLWVEEYWYEPAIYDNDVELGIRNTHRNFISGLGFPTMGSLMRAHVPNYDLNQVESDPGAVRMSYFANFFRGLDLRNFAPASDRVDRGQCGRFGSDFVIFLPGGGNVQLDLTGAGGYFSVQVLDINTGVMTPLADLTGGAPRLIQSGTNQDSSILVKYIGDQPSPTPTLTPTETATASLTPTATETPTGTASPTPLPTAEPSATETTSPTITLTPADMPTPTPTLVASPMETATQVLSSTATPAQTATDTITLTPTVPAPLTSTLTPSLTATVTATSTQTPSPTGTFVPSATPTRTASPTVSPTASSTLTVTPIWTAMATPTRTPTATWTPSPTRTATSTLTHTPTPAPTSVISLLFSDYFNRADSAVVGNGWTEVEISGAAAAIQGNRLCLVDTAGNTNRPLVRHSFPQVANGQLTWTFDLDWKRLSYENDYRVFIQLGQASLLNDNDLNAGAGVNLVWTNLNGVQDTLAYRDGGVTTGLGVASGPATIQVVADLGTHTYQVRLNGTLVDSNLPFNQAVPLDTVRYFSDMLTEQYFSGRCLDNLAIEFTNPLPPTLTPTATAPFTPTGTASATWTLPPSLTATSPASSTPLPTPTETATRTPTSTATITPSPIGTNIPTATPTETASVTVTSTATLTLAPTTTGTATQTSTPIPTTTFTFTPTPTTTAVATSTPTSLPDLIFADDFETGGLAAWSSGVTGSGNLTVTASNPLQGIYSMLAVIDDNNPLYVADDNPPAEPRYRVRFAFDPNSIRMSSGNSLVIFQGQSGVAGVLRMELRYYNGSYQVRVGLSNDSSSWRNSSYIRISDSVHTLELDWKASSRVGASDGYLTLWVDGSQRASLTGVDNDTRRIESVRLGAVSGVDTGTRGGFLFDIFESRRQTYIGP